MTRRAVMSAVINDALTRCISQFSYYANNLIKHTSNTVFRVQLAILFYHYLGLCVMQTKLLATPMRGVMTSTTAKIVNVTTASGQ